MTNEEKYTALLAGATLVVGSAFINWADDHYEHNIRTCMNRNRVGTKDVFVAWILPAAEPADLTRDADGFAWGSAK